jgi:hypothetical protein
MQYKIYFLICSWDERLNQRELWILFSTNKHKEQHVFSPPNTLY